MTLKPGWNEVGNPYPVPVSWDNVIELNKKENPSAIFSKLTIYDGSVLKEATDGTLLNAYEGGFVKNLTSSDITIQIPFNGQTSIGGREWAVTTDLNKDSWKIFLHIAQESLVNQLGGFGMNPEAKIGEDELDSFNPPSILEIPVVEFINEDDQSIRLSGNIIPTQEQYVWHFKPAGIMGRATLLTWNSDIMATEKDLFLFNEETLEVINMYNQSSYSFHLTEKSSFRIFYGREMADKIVTSYLVATNPSPNPLNQELTTSMRVSLPKSEQDYTIHFKLYSMQGVEVKSFQITRPYGIHNLQFNLEGMETSGLYIYRLMLGSGDQQKIYTGKIIKP